MTDYSFSPTLTWDLGGSVKIARSQRVDVLDPDSGATAPGLKQEGQPVSWVTSDKDGIASFTSTLPHVRIVAKIGNRAVPFEVVSPDAYEEASSAAASAASAASDASNAASSAAASAALVGAPAKSAMDAAMGGDVAGLVPAVAARRKKGSTITPDDFAGTDRAKLQAAVNYCTANGYPTIILDRMLDLTGAAPVSIDKAVWSVRDTVTFEGSGGGIIKNDAGVVFTSATENTGDVSFRGVKYVSTAGAGAVLLDCDKLLRCFSTGCEYRNWDLIARQVVDGRWGQSMRFLNEKIIGGAGPAFLFREAIDCTFDGILCEDRLTGTAGGLFANSDGTMSVIANRNLRIVNTCVENCSGIPIRLAMCYGTVLQGNYFEHTGAATDPQIDLYTLAPGQISVALIGNEFNLKPEQIAAHTPAVLLGKGRTQDVTTSTSNVAEGGVLYKFGDASGKVNASGDTVEGGGLLIYPGQEDRYRTPAGKSTTTATRPKNPRIGEPYFDTTLGKLVTAKTAGTAASIALQFSAGATASGTITITIGGVGYAVAVSAGDSKTQVRDKVVASSAFWPTWRLSAFDTDTVSIDAYSYGLVSGLSFAAGGTGVTQSYFAFNTAGTNPVWVDGSGATA